MLFRNWISEYSKTQITFSVGESVSFKTKVCVSTSTFGLTMSWINEAEMAEIYRRSHDVAINQMRVFPDFEMLDAGIASALRKIISRKSFRKRFLKSSELRNIKKKT